MLTGTHGTATATAPLGGPAGYCAVDEDRWGAKGTDSSVKNKTLSAGCFPVMAKGLFQKKGLWIWAFDWIPTVPFVRLRSQLPALAAAWPWPWLCSCREAAATRASVPWPSVHTRKRTHAGNGKRGQIQDSRILNLPKKDH